MVRMFSKLLAAVLSFAFASAALAQDALFIKPSVTLASISSGEYTPEIQLAAIDNISGFAGAWLSNGGLFTELVATAMIRAKSERSYNFAFLPPEVSAQPPSSFDLSFPWFVPDCTNILPLNAADQKICSDFVASQPYFQIEVGMFVRFDSDLLNVTTAEALRGTHICRPAGFMEFDLAQAGLMPPAIMFSTPETLQECLVGLANGLYDVVSADSALVEKSVTMLGLTGAILKNESLGTLQTLHVLAPRSNPNGRAYLATLNIGMREMRLSGEWFSIVQKHMSAQQ